jgi:hypothetical protein
MSETPPKLHVLFRPGSPSAVVLRKSRGGKVFCTIGWDLATDVLSLGQWCKHKIYTHRCDLSGNGRWMVYFALNGRWSSLTRGAWTALSRAPYLKAVTLWPQGHAWGGGGLFLDADSLPDPVAGARSAAFVVDKEVRLTLGAHASYVARLTRDGWTQAKRGFDKRVDRAWTLRKVVRRESVELHELRHSDGRVIELSSWEWADLDSPRRRLIFAEEGSLYSATIGPDGLGQMRRLFDARPMSFQAIAAPYEEETRVIVSGARTPSFRG